MFSRFLGLFNFILYIWGFDICVCKFIYMCIYTCIFLYSYIFVRLDIVS